MTRVIRYVDSNGQRRKLFLNSYANKDVDVWDVDVEGNEQAMYSEYHALKREQQQEEECHGT